MSILHVVLSTGMLVSVRFLQTRLDEYVRSTVQQMLKKPSPLDLVHQAFSSSFFRPADVCTIISDRVAYTTCYINNFCDVYTSC